VANPLRKVQSTKYKVSAVAARRIIQDPLRGAKHNLVGSPRSGAHDFVLCLLYFVLPA
jgi:hypothetical protein